MCVIHLLFACAFYSQRAFTQLVSSSKTMASQKMGNQCKGLSLFIARLRLYGIQTLWDHFVTSGMQKHSPWLSGGGGGGGRN